MRGVGGLRRIEGAKERGEGKFERDRAWVTENERVRRAGRDSVIERGDLEGLGAEMD